MAAGDPYSSIKDELDAELQLITRLQAKLFAGHPEAAPQLRSHLANVAEQLRALEVAVKSMVENPARFQLDSTTAFMRQVEVEGLRFQYQELQASCSQVSTGSMAQGQQQQQQQQWREVEMRAGANGSAQHSSSARLPPPPIRHSKLVQQQQPQQHHNNAAGAAAAAAAGKHSKRSSNSSSSAGGWSDFTPPGTAAGSAAAAAAADGGEDDTARPWDTFNYETAMQQQLLRQQDEELGHISVHVDRIKQQGLAMNEELEQQSLLLGGLEDHTDTTTLRLRGLRAKVTDVIKRSRQDKQLCTILFLSALLVVLTLIALA